MRRIPLAIGAAALVLTGGGVIATNGEAQDAEGETLEFVSKGGSFKFIDVKPKAKGEEDASAGDSFLLSVGIFDGGKRVGTLDARCTFTKSGKRLRGLCDGIYDLPKGTITVVARLSDNDTRGTVTGGTGDYVGAEGTFDSVDRPGRKGGDPSDETITLLP